MGHTRRGDCHMSVPPSTGRAQPLPGRVGLRVVRMQPVAAGLVAAAQPVVNTDPLPLIRANEPDPGVPEMRVVMPVEATIPITVESLLDR